MDYTLSITFICASGDKASISIDGVNPLITQDQVSNLMDTIISKNIFLTSNGALTSKYNAQLTGKQVTKFEVA